MLGRRDALRWAAAVALLLHAGGPPAIAQPCAFVTNHDSDSVSVIDTSTNTITRTLRLYLLNQCSERRPPGAEPRNIAVTPDGRFAYVTTDNCFLGVMDTQANRIVDVIVPQRNQLLGGPVAIAPNGTRAYVDGGWGEAQQNTLAVIDTSTNTVIARVPVGGGPSDIALTPDGRLAYVTDPGPNFDPTSEPDAVWVVDTATNTVSTRIVVGDRPRPIAISPDGTFAYVVNVQHGTISVIDTTANVVTVTLPGGASDLAFAPDGTRAYLTQEEPGPSFEGLLAVMDTATNEVSTRIHLGTRGAPEQIAITSDGAFVYLTNPERDTVSVVDAKANTLLATIPMLNCGRERDPHGPCSPTGIAIADVPGGCAACSGDCNADEDVTTDELLTGVNMALGKLPLATCRAFDATRGGEISIGKIVRAVIATMDRCKELQHR